MSAPPPSEERPLRLVLVDDQQLLRRGLGMLLSTIGAILVVAWMGPRDPQGTAPAAADSAAADSSAERRGDATRSTGEETSA